MVLRDRQTRKRNRRLPDKAKELPLHKFLQQLGLDELALERERDFGRDSQFAVIASLAKNQKQHQRQDQTQGPSPSAQDDKPKKV